MTHVKIPSGGKLAVATVVATAMAAVPVAFGPAFIPQPNAALAQSNAGGTSGPGVAEERATERADGTTIPGESVYEILGTTAEEVASEEAQVSASTESGPLQAYQHEMESGNLAGASNALAAVANRPITEAMVLNLNNALGIETTLIAKQVAEVAASKQDPDDITYDESSAVTPELTIMRETTASLSGNMNSLTVSSRQFGAYEWAMRRGNLDLASTALADAADRPITVELVNEVNNELGVDSTLSSAQVAEATRAKQRSSY
jgi:hypothetical protein